MGRRLRGSSRSSRSIFIITGLVKRQLRLHQSWMEIQAEMDLSVSIMLRTMSPEALETTRALWQLRQLSQHRNRSLRRPYFRWITFNGLLSCQTIDPCLPSKSRRSSRHRTDPRFLPIRTKTQEDRAMAAWIKASITNCFSGTRSSNRLETKPAVIIELQQLISSQQTSQGIRIRISRAWSWLQLVVSANLRLYLS